MPLTDSACRNAKCPEGRLCQRYADAGGLYLEVTQTGAKLSRWKYRYAGKEKRLVGLADAGYPHRVTVISASPEPAHEVMPRVHKVAALLKRWLLGTLQGGIQHQHLDYYLDEFTFRFNRRRSRARGLLFHRLAQQAVAVGPAPHHVITSGP